MDKYSIIVGDIEIGEITSTLTNEKAKEILTAFEQSGYFENRSKVLLELVMVTKYNCSDISVAQACSVLEDAKRLLLETTLIDA